jgi:glycosyltransferase involved in cell wall biosynthesis
VELANNASQPFRAVNEVAAQLRQGKADILCCHGYKPDILGLLAGRWAKVPVIAVARGWTSATRKVRLNEALDRLALRWMDRVVCVSEAQAIKVRHTGISGRRVVVIPNAIDSERFRRPDPLYKERLDQFFPLPCEHIVGAAGRLSPEKGFAVLVEAAARVLHQHPRVGFVLFGEGPLRAALSRAVADHGLENRFILAGFREDFEQYLPHFDVLVLPSFTEGLPNVVLEALAAGVPVVATDVGGTPEVVDEGVSGFLVAPGDSEALANKIVNIVTDDEVRRALGRRGKKRVQEHFTPAAQAAKYQEVFAEVIEGKRTRIR